MANVRTFKFTAGTTPLGNDLGILTWQLPIITQADFMDIVDSASLKGSGSKTLINFATGPTEHYYEMRDGGFDPKNQMRVPLVAANSGRFNFITAGIWNFWGCFNTEIERPESLPNYSPFKIYLTNSAMSSHGAYYEVTLDNSGAGCVLIDPNNWSGLGANNKSILAFTCGLINLSAGNKFGVIYFPYLVQNYENGTASVKSFCTFLEYVDGGALAKDSATQKITSPWYYESDTAGELLLPSEVELEKNPNLGDFGFNESVLEQLDTGNPYQPGGESSTGGFGGNFDDSSDPIDIPTLPIWESGDTGMCSIFNPDFSEIVALSTYLWSDNVVDIVRRVFANPMDVIISLHALPLHIPEYGRDEIHVGPIPTGVNASKIANQWIQLDCGTVAVEEYWGGFMDYSPYTTIELYLPYCGTIPIDVDLVMGHSMGIKYNIDCASGDCVAYITSDGFVFAQASGNCKYSIPVSSSDFGNIVAGALSLITGFSYSKGTPTKTKTTSYVRYTSKKTGRKLPAPKKEKDIITTTPGNDSQIGYKSLSSAVNDVLSSKPVIHSSGSIAGNAGILSIPYPYLIIKRPKQVVASSQGEYVGFPLWQTLAVSECQGWTEFSEIHFENLPYTSEELEELEGIMKEGVIL